MVVSVKRVCCTGFAAMAMSVVAHANIPWTYRIENHPADVVATSSGTLGEPLDAVAVASVPTESWSLDSIVEVLRSSAGSCLNTFKQGLGMVIR